MKIRVNACVVAYILAFVIPMWAQDAPPQPGPRRPLAAAQRILDLNDQQVQQLADLRKAHADSLSAIRTQRRDLATTIADLLKSANPDPAQLGSLILQEKALRQQIQTANEQYHTNALALLTETQKQKVSQIQEALKLAPQAGPLAALGLIEGPGPGFGRRGMDRGFEGMGMPGGPGPAGPGPERFRMMMGPR